MSFVIDANIFAAFYQEDVLGLTTSQTAPVKPVVDAVLVNCGVSIDEGGHIESEWDSVAESEWFCIWLTDRLRDGHVNLVPTSVCRELRRTLVLKGFPKSKDIWYIRVAKKLTEDFDESYILSEDMDFFDPREKNCSANRRHKILTGSMGRVAKHLRKRESINVVCVSEARNGCE